VAGLVILLGVEEDVAGGGGEGEAVVAGGGGDPALDGGGDVDGDVDAGGGGVEAGDSRADRGDRALGDDVFVPGRGDRGDVHGSVDEDAVDEYGEGGLGDLAGGDSGGQSSEIELHETRVAAADVDVGKRAEVCGGTGRGDEGVAGERDLRGMSGGGREERGQQKGYYRSDGTEGGEETRGRKKLVQGKLPRALIKRP